MKYHEKSICHIDKILIMIISMSIISRVAPILVSVLALDHFSIVLVLAKYAIQVPSTDPAVNVRMAMVCDTASMIFTL